MKLFGRTGGYYLFWTSAIYLAVGLPCALYYKYIPTPFIQMIWLLVLMLPFVVPPIGRYFNLAVEWDKAMIDWFNKNKSPGNVVPFPGSENTPKTIKNPYMDPVPAPKKESKTYYTIGLTDDNRVSFHMGYSTLTMNSVGVQNLIDQLELLKNQLGEE